MLKIDSTKILQTIKVKLQNLKGHQKNFFEVSYDDYKIVDEQILPTRIRFSNNGLENLYIEIKSISAPEKINIPFRIPKNYKRIKL